jgi:nitric oxide reductase NorQ protein
MSTSSYDLKNPTIWFFKTINEKNETGVPRLRLLPNQYCPKDGDFEKIDDLLNVQAQSKPREVNPIGTIFAAKALEKKTVPGGTQEFYSVMGQSLIVVDKAETADVKGAYREYMAQSGTVLEDEEELTGATPKASPARTLLDTLLKNFPKPTIAKDNFYVDADVWAALLLNTERGYNTMLVGDSGCGKTELVLLMGKVQKRDVAKFDMAAKQDPIASLVGVHRFEDGKSVFDRADFTYALEKDGIILLDELPRAPVNTNNILFPVLDSRRELSMDIACSGARHVKVNEKCRFIATANEGFEYTGNNVLDRALKERFQIIPIEYMPNPQEIELLYGRTKVDKKYADVIVKTAKTIRDMYKKEDLSSSVSIRHTLYAADLTACGVPVNKAMEISFLPMFIGAEEKTKVKGILAAR